jgi:hypothetical protein
VAIGTINGILPPFDRQFQPLFTMGTSSITGASHFSDSSKKEFCIFSNGIPEPQKYLILPTASGNISGKAAKNIDK